MAITGAIFDCDGTLLDSMPMWQGVFGKVVGEENAAGQAERIRQAFMDTIMLPLREQCHAVKELLGDIWTSEEDPFEEVAAAVRREYEESVEPFAGVRAFLDELAAAGVPMAVASSTSTAEVRHALAAHGLDGYFETVVSTEDVGGNDKDKPDVYLEALARIGGEPGSTWVFEDSPQAAATARAAGFKVAGLINDHDGRDEAELSSAVHILAHSWGELSLALLDDYACETGEREGVLRALVVDGSPAQPPAELVASLAADADYVIAADRGVDSCFAAQVMPGLICGDADSASDEALAWARAAGVREILFPTEKYATDLALAIDCAHHEAARRRGYLSLAVTGAAGGRPDHALGALGLLAKNAGAAPRQVEEGFELRILGDCGEGCWKLGEGACGKTFSIIPLTEGCNVSLSGMRWNLDGAELPLFSDRGVSNVVVDAAACVTVHAGLAAAYLLA